MRKPILENTIFIAITLLVVAVGFSFFRESPANAAMNNATQRTGGGNAISAGEDDQGNNRGRQPEGNGPGAMHYFVDPNNGNDAWSGTLGTPSASKTDGPLATLNAARLAVEKAARHGGSAPITVMLENGTYYVPSTVQFSSADSGTNSAPVIYENYRGATPIVSGGMHVTGWRNIAGQSICAGNSNCWQVKLPASARYFESLFYNGERRFRPRVGATASNLLGQFYKNANSENTYSDFQYSTGDPISASWRNLNDPYPAGDIEVYDFEKWSIDVQRIRNINGGNQIISLTGSTQTDRKNHGYLPHHRYLIENVKDLLKYPGQWFLDRSTSPWTLTYLAKSGENPNSGTVIIPQLSQVIVAQGLQWVTFQGIQFMHDNYTVPASGYKSVQLDPAITAMVDCQNCENVTFTNDTFAHTTGVGLAFVGNSSKVTIKDDLFYDIGASGIRLGERPSPRDTDATVPHNILLTRNTLTGVARTFPSNDCVETGDIHDVTFSSNTCTDSYHMGFEICEPLPLACGGGEDSNGAFNLTVENNDVWNLMQGITSDGACYYAQTQGIRGEAKGNKMIHNRCHDVSDDSALDPDGYGGNGLYLDNTTGGWDVEQNLVYRVSGVAFNMTDGPKVPGEPNVYKNNIGAYFRKALVGVNCTTEPVQQFVFANNIAYFDRSLRSDPRTTMQKRPIYFGGGNPTLKQDFAHNNYYNSTEDFASDPKTFGYFANNQCGGKITVLNFAGWQQIGEDSGSVVQNPRFIKPSCTYSTAAACAADPKQDDYSFSGAAPNGFRAFNMQFGNTNAVSIPRVQASFPTAPFSPATDF
jgi:hypothetical protein